MRFAIFTNQLSRVAAESDGLAEQFLKASLLLLPSCCQLMLGDSLQEPAARNVLDFNLRIDTRQQVIGN